MLFDRTEAADGNGDGPGNKAGEEGDEDCQPEPFADQFFDWTLVQERHAWIAAQQVAEPVEVLQVDRLVQVVRFPQLLDLFLVDRLTRFFEGGDVGGEIISWRKLDDDKRNQRDHEQSRDHPKETRGKAVIHFSLARLRSIRGR